MTDYQAYPIAEGPLKVEGIKALHGANYFSAGPVIILRVNLGEYDEVFTNEIEGFFEKLRALLPSLKEHHCSPGHPGGFFERIVSGTLLGHVTEHVAIELQTLAGMDVGYGKTRSTATPGVYNVVFRFLDEHVGVYTAKAALNAVNGVLTGAACDVRETIETLVRIREVRLLGPSTQAIVTEAARRGIPHQRLDEHNLVQLGTGLHQKRIRATVTSDTSLLAVETAASKYLSTRMLEDAGIPVPATERIRNPAQAEAFLQALGGPVVVKPGEGTLGRGVSLRLADPERIPEAVVCAQAVHDEVLVQEFVPGHTYRLLVIDHELVAAAEVTPPSITGDGVRSIAKLIKRLNADPDRDVGDKSLLTTVEIDDVTERLLADRGYTPETVMREGETLPLEVSGSLKLGGESTDVTDSVHPANRMLAERASRAIGLDVAGVDVIAMDIGESILETSGAVLGVSAAPDFRMHLSPTRGESRNVAAVFLDLLFEDDRHTRVPILAVTGTRGTTEAARLIDHCLRAAHYHVGLACAEGLFVNGERLIEGDMAGHRAAGITLKDTSIDCAVFEVPVRTILERGLGYEYADVGLVLEIHDSGETFDETRLLEDIAYAASVVAEQVFDEGFSVLNADCEHTLEMRERLYGRAVLFTEDSSNPEVQKHVAEGGKAVVREGDQLIALDGDRRIEILNLAEHPDFASWGTAPACDFDDPQPPPPPPVSWGTAPACGAVAALYAFGVAVDRIREGYLSYVGRRSTSSP